jgi:hypothetical protein
MKRDGKLGILARKGESYRNIYKAVKKGRILQNKGIKGQESWKMIAISKENCGKKT